MLNKPPHGAPCNGCGGCCIDRRCPLGERLFGPGGNCPALERVIPSLAFTCGVIRRPAHYAPAVVAQHGEDAARKAAALLMGAGLGCDALIAGEPRNDRWMAWALGQIDRAEAAKAAEVWRVA